MFEIKPNSLYSLDELAELLPGKMTLATLLDRLGLRDRRVFRDAVFGHEILEAARQAKPFTTANSPPASVVSMTQRGRGGRGRGRAAPVRRLSARDLDESVHYKLFDSPPSALIVSIHNGEVSQEPE